MLEQMKLATERDSNLQRLIQAIQRRYINKPARSELQLYCPYNELLIAHGLVLWGSKLVVPESLRKQVVALAHEGHQGIARTKQFLRATTWFPGMDKLVEKDPLCMPCQVTVTTPQQEPLKPTTLTSKPGDVLGSMIVYHSGS